MCKTLGRDFVPYVANVIPSVLRVASTNADIMVTDVGQEEDLEQDGWETLEVRGKIIAIKTSLLEEKVQAMSVISIFAQVLEGDFAPFVLEVLKTAVIPGLSFFINDSVRAEAAGMIPYLLNSFKLAHGVRSPELAGLWETALDAVLESLQNGQPAYLQSDTYQCFYESVEVLGKECLTPHYMDTFMSAAKSSLEEYRGRAQNRQRDQQENEEGEEESDELMEEIEEDKLMLADMNKAFHTIFKNQGISFLPAWSHLLPVYDAFAASPDASQRQWALCVLDDALEFCDEQSWNYQQHIRPPLLAGLRDPDAPIRQAACYGIGMAGLKGGAPWSAFAIENIPTLLEIARATDRSDEEQIMAGENACAAVSKILEKHADQMPNAQEVVAHWLATLPIIYDDEAAPYAYRYLVTLVDR